MPFIDHKYHNNVYSRAYQRDYIEYSLKILNER